MLHANNTKRAFFLFALAAIIATASSFTAINNKKHAKGSASHAEVMYAGTQEGLPLFHLLYDNRDSSRFSVSIMDADGYTLFQSVYNDRKFDRVFMIADPEATAKLTFVIRDLADHSEQAFEINANTRLVEDVDVRELK